MSNLQYCIEKASELPYKRSESRHYSVVVNKRGKIVGEAANSYTKTHTIMAKTSKRLGLEKEYCHAECLAIVRARGKGHKIYIARVDSRGNACYSAPCPVCAVLIKEAGIKVVEFSV